MKKIVLTTILIIIVFVAKSQLYGYIPKYLPNRIDNLYKVKGKVNKIKITYSYLNDTCKYKRNTQCTKNKYAVNSIENINCYDPFRYSVERVEYDKRNRVKSIERYSGGTLDYIYSYDYNLFGQLKTEIIEFNYKLYTKINWTNILGNYYKTSKEYYAKTKSTVKSNFEIKIPLFNICFEKDKLSLGQYTNKYFAYPFGKIYAAEIKETFFTFKYDQHNNLKELTHKGYQYLYKKKYEYKYDTYGNWTERIEYYYLYYYKFGPDMKKPVLYLYSSSPKRIFHREITYGDPIEKQMKEPYLLIGNQIWMDNNLDVVTYRNGDTIPQVKNPEEWKELKSGAWCYNKKGFGKLYNWYAVNDPRGLAPDGWQIPSSKEWQVLLNHCGGELSAGIYLRAEKDWEKMIKTNNRTKFTALPAGKRTLDGRFLEINESAYFWTSTADDSSKAIAWSTYYYGSAFYKEYADKSCGFSVRCIKIYNS